MGRYPSVLMDNQFYQLFEWCRNGQFSLLLPPALRALRCSISAKTLARSRLQEKRGKLTFLKCLKFCDEVILFLLSYKIYKIDLQVLCSDFSYYGILHEHKLQSLISKEE